MAENILLTAVIDGLMIGAVYALVSIGLNIIFGVMDFVNFAHGEFLMLSMYGTYFLHQLYGVNPIMSLVVMIPLMFVVGVFTQRVLFQPVLDAPSTMQIFTSLGLLLILQNAALYVFGSGTRSINSVWTGSTATILGVHLSYAKLIAFGLSIVTTIALFTFLQYTHLGRVIRATAQNPDGAELMGINTKVIYMFTFGLGLALVTIAAAPLAMIYFITPTIGTRFVLIAFVVVVLGGLGNLRGALYAGLFIGVLESLTSVYLSAQIAPAIYFTLFLVVLFLRSRYGALRGFVPRPFAKGVGQ